MPLVEEYQSTGNWLFKRRGYLPLVLVFAGIAVLFFSVPANPPFWYKMLCLFICFTGMSVRGFTIGHTPKHTSGRNIKSQKASQLNSTGIYSVVRHPLYLGNFFIWLGLALFLGHGWFVAVAVLVFWIYYERIMFAEEAFLSGKFGEEYREWASRTPAIIPAVRGYRPPALSFSFRNILKREYNGLGNIVLAFSAIEFGRSSLIHRRIFLETGWLIFFIAGFLIWLALRSLEKNTRLFEVEGR